MCVSVINTVYLVFSKMGKWKMSWFDSFLLFPVWTLHPRVLQMTLPENGLATAECDFTEREAVWTGFFFFFLYGLIKKQNTHKKQNKKTAILFNYLKSRSRSGGVEPWFHGEALPASLILTM